MASEEKAQRLLANSRLHPGLLGLITPCPRLPWFQMDSLPVMSGDSSHI
jgi:hypothetical protein